MSAEFQEAEVAAAVEQTRQFDPSIPLKATGYRGVRWRYVRTLSEGLVEVVGPFALTSSRGRMPGLKVIAAELLSEDRRCSRSVIATDPRISRLNDAAHNFRRRH